MNLVVLAEGAGELSRFWKTRNLLDIIPDAQLGALEIIAKRIAESERPGESVNVVAFSPHLPSLRPGHVCRASLTDVLKHADLLRQVLLVCFVPVRDNVRARAADLAIIGCDAEIAQLVGQAIAAVEPYLPGPLLHFAFDPEFEVVLYEKRALDAVTGWNVSLPTPSEPEYGSKEALKRSLWAAGYQGAIDSDLYGTIARSLSLDHLKAQPSIARAIEAWNKKGRRIAAS